MPTRSRQLTEKGFELLERNLRGKCKSEIRSATTVANKLGPLLQDENVEIECIKSYLIELEQRVSAMITVEFRSDDTNTRGGFQIVFSGRHFSDAVSPR